MTANSFLFGTFALKVPRECAILVQLDKVTGIDRKIRRLGRVWETDRLRLQNRKEEDIETPKQRYIYRTDIKIIKPNH